ncbi:hypothetical protein ACWGJP_07970 [Microbacterium sp. NPDC055903]
MNEKSGRTPHPEDPAEGPEATPEPEQGDAPLGGDETTEQQLDADVAVEEDTLRTLDPDDPPA